ncbi:unnamed protein product [Protopolystoma xenopodis]|uniref:GPI-anchored wall transfer protein 1 n=1 Tax=Protopolystoma xenopodis TaxID=117903 RepID=A0A3S5CD23_9PLAT|nr:unnamed protein product [Protopolystoma xenopodis]
MLRSVLLKMIGYQEHVTEYGVHWNFLYTLALLRIFGFLLFLFYSLYSESRVTNLSFTRSRVLLKFVLHAAIITTALQVFLGLEKYGFSLQRKLALPDHRHDNQSLFVSDPTFRSKSFWLANAEGLASLPGYCAVYCWGAAFELWLSGRIGVFSRNKYRV